jgi:hypothetical protein
MLQLEDPDARLEVLEALTRLSSELPWVQLELARHRAGRGDRQRALHHVELFQGLEPGAVDGNLLRQSLDQGP